MRGGVTVLLKDIGKGLFNRCWSRGLKEMRSLRNMALKQEGVGMLKEKHGARVADRVSKKKEELSKTGRSKSYPAPWLLSTPGGDSQRRL